MIHAIIPAAGRSGRMGRPKQLIDVGGRPMLLAVAEPIVACERIDRTIVVTNSLVASAIDPEGAGVAVVLNDEPDAEMIDSIRLGIEALQRDPGLAVEDGLLVCPADQPGLTSAEIADCCAAYSAQPGRIIVAAHDGKRGHPLIFPASRIPFLMSPACDRGLRELVNAHAEHVSTVELANSAVLRNVNTPEDYNQIRSHG